MQLANIINPEGGRPITESDLTMHEVFREWTRLMTAQVNGGSLIFGTGTPEGNVEASEGATYQDKAGTASNIRYAKRDNDIAGDKSLGWILI